MDKRFLQVDKTGRGICKIMDEQEMFDADEDYNNGLQRITDWAESAQMGDIYETPEEKITRIR